MVTATGIKVSD